MFRLPSYAFAMQRDIEAAIRTGLKVSAFSISDESHRHRRGKESHFVVHVESSDFQGMPQVKRHQKVYQLCTEQFQQGLHSLSLKCSLADSHSPPPKAMPCLHPKKGN